MPNGPWHAPDGAIGRIRVTPEMRAAYEEHAAGAKGDDLARKYGVAVKTIYGWFLKVRESIADERALGSPRR